MEKIKSQNRFDYIINDVSAISSLIAKNQFGLEIMFLVIRERWFKIDNKIIKGQKIFK